MTIPIIIVNWNGYDDTMECMSSVMRSSYADFKIYLVDNGSANEEGTVLRNKWASESRVEVRLLPANAGFAQANNLILQELIESKEKVVVLLNNDTVVDEDWLEEFIKARTATQADMISAKFLNYYQRHKIDNLGHQMLNTGEIVPIGHGQPSDHFLSSFANVGPCAGAALYSLEMLRDIGIFDDYFSTGYEDAELGLRATVAGYRGVYAPDVVVYHKMGQSIKKVFNQEYALMIQSSIWYTYFKLMPLAVILVSLPFIMIKIVLLTALNMVFFRWNFLAIQWRALWKTVTDLNLIRIKRNVFFHKRRVISSWSILKKQRFFLMFDLERFYRIFIQKNKSALDSYGGK